MSNITTLYSTFTPSRDASVRLVQREASKPFAVIVDLPDHYAVFNTFADFDRALECFNGSVDQITTTLALTVDGSALQ